MGGYGSRTPRRVRASAGGSRTSSDSGGHGGVPHRPCELADAVGRHSGGSGARRRSQRVSATALAAHPRQHHAPSFSVASYHASAVACAVATYHAASASDAVLAARQTCHHVPSPACFRRRAASPPGPASSGRPRHPRRPGDAPRPPPRTLRPQRVPPHAPSPATRRRRAPAPQLPRPLQHASGRRHSQPLRVTGRSQWPLASPLHARLRPCLCLAHAP